MDFVVLGKALELSLKANVVIAHLYGTQGKMEKLKEICD